MATKTTTKTTSKPTVVSSTASKYAGKTIQTLSNGTKVRVSNNEAKSGKKAVDLGMEIAAEKVGAAPQVPEVKDSPIAPSVTQSQMPPVQITPNAVPPTAEANQAVQNGYVKSPEEYTNAVKAGQDMASRYRQGFEQMQQSGAPAPETQGQAMSGIAGALPEAPQDMSSVDLMLQEDEGYKGLQDMFKEYFNPDTQKTSLVKEYKKLYKDSGLNELDEEILDAKTIIEGTEDDIRNEIQAAGGFGTESQVQALASSRNKVLLKNYNNLVAMREMKQNNFDTMLDLTMKDREYADQKAEQMLNFQFKVMDYKQKFIDNTRSQLVTMGDKLGFDTLYQAYSKDPRQLAFAEQILGLGSGGLQMAATQAQSQRLRDEQKENLQLDVLRSNLATDVMTRKNIQSQIDERNGLIDPLNVPESLNLTVRNPLTGKPNPTSQFANVMKQTGAKTDDKLKLTGSVIKAVQDFATANSTGNFAGTGPLRAPGYFVSQEGQDNRTYLDSLEGTIEAWMTGASVGDDQQKRIKETMVPRRGDTDKQIRNKSNALTNYMLSYASGQLATQGIDWQPEKIDYFSKPIITAPDGNEIEIID